MSGYPTNTGRALNAKWKVGAQHALFHKFGIWYMPLTRFPGALFDPHGYVVFSSEQAYRRCPQLRIGSRVDVPDGIASIPGYKRMS